MKRFFPAFLPVLALAAFCAPARADAPAIRLPDFSSPFVGVGRVAVEQGKDSVTIANGFLMTPETWKDASFSFRAQAPAEPVQIWGGIRVRDRNSRYVVGVRGGVEPQVSFARYAPDGKSMFLGWAPLDPAPKVGEWIAVRVVASGKRFHIYLNDEKLPRINIEDKTALWEEGGVALGGGWLRTEFANPKVEPLDKGTLAAFQAVGNNTWAPPAVDKAVERERQRAAYQAAEIKALPEVRGGISLDGDWLFMPDQDLPAGEQASSIAAPKSSDEKWHVMPVPAFWTPTVGWLHGEGDMPGLTGMASSRGPSDMLIAGEYARLDKLTFDWRKTKSGWYRHHLDLPANLEGRHFELVFDAISKISEVWVNGKLAGSNVGMFREVRCDVTPFLKPGRNVIAVHDIGNPEREVKDAKKVADIAVTVAVTFEMLNSLPHGMTDNNSGGIWQPVRLEVTNPVRVTDVFVQPALDGATAEVELTNASTKAAQVALDWNITADKGGNAPFYSGSAVEKITVPAGKSATVKLATPKLVPKLWTPADPNLYHLNLTVREGSGIVDREQTRFGFRTFGVAGGKLLLNGKPYWLRGGNHFPVTLRPNDATLAKTFMELAKAGNVAVTRSHAIPFTTPWFEAADEVGMGVSYEGTWPWLMLNGQVPSEDLLKVWREEFASLIKRHRNHPSLFYWTVNNEMKFPILEKLGDDVLKQKWTVLDGMITKMRELDPTRPIVADSAFTRKEEQERSRVIRLAEKFDDGDIDDAHRYYGWYNESPFHLFDGKFGNTIFTGRPLISQEMSTGYPRNDDWPSRSYQFTRYVPQALVGDYAFEQNDPAIFMTRQAFMTKEVAEAIRRTNRDNANGILHFAYLTWFTNVWKADSIRPKLTYYELKTALQPVLVSAELYGRHFYAGDSPKIRVCLANDAEDTRDLPAGQLKWEIVSGKNILAQGSVATPKLPYYSNQWVPVELKLPEALPSPRVDAKLKFRLECDGKTVSENHYDILLGTREWAASKAPGQLYDPAGRSKATTEGLGLTSIASLAQANPAKSLVIGDPEKLDSAAAAKLRAFAEAGGRVLLLQPGASLVKLFPEQIKSHRVTQGEIVTMSIPESPVFDGLEPLDTAWFEMGDRKLPYACSGTYEVDRSQPGVQVLAQETKLHPDIPKGEFFKESGAPIVEIKVGKGTVLASEMMLSTKSVDPVAGRLLRNMLESLE